MRACVGGQAAYVAAFNPKRDGRPDAMIVNRSSLETIGTIAAENGIPIFELTHERATLEDRFLELTGERGNVR